MCRRLTALVLLPLLLVFAAACGDGDDDTGDASASAEETEEASGGDNRAFCQRATDIEQHFAELDSGLEGDELPSADLFGEVADALESLGEDAPSDIESDLETVAGGVRRIAEVFGDIDLTDPEALSDPETMAELEEIGAEMEEVAEEMEAASERIAEHLREECGIDIDGGDDADGEGETTEPEPTETSTEE